MKLPTSGIYTAAAVEWSGLESKPSQPLQIGKDAFIRILAEKPADFSWEADRWLVDGKEVSSANAKEADAAIREIVHRLDGVIHREWYERGVITKRHDLNVQGKACRRLFYEKGKLARREYHNRDDEHVSTEWFDAEGFITETIFFQKGNEYSHWWYDRGMPIKYIGRGDRGANTTPKGAGVYEKQGDNWVKTGELEK